MPQNRNKLIELFIRNIYNAIVHEILRRSINQEELSNKYNKELLTSLEIAKRYREKINPINTVLPYKDITYIKDKITNKVKIELLLRISKGYKNIDLNLIEELVDKYLKKTKVV